MKRTVLCCAVFRDGCWQGICLDFDIAVQGASFEQVQEYLNVAVSDYLDEIRTLPEADRVRLENRRAPLLVRLKFFYWLFVSLFLRGGKDGSHRQFTLATA